ncbi:MAG: putative porin, partial [Muribaculaceae bacterium]|nr:putative porin [Muribaculaceae bacterium]
MNYHNIRSHIENSIKSCPVLRIVILFALVIISATGSFAQGDRDWDPHAMPGQESRHESIKLPSAWTLTYPLGFHVPADVDTAQYNYQRRSIPTMASDAWATTGNLGSPGMNLLWFEKAKPSGFIFFDALEFWMPSFAKQKFHNIYVPTTILQYNYCGSSESHQDRLQADFAGNVNRRIGIGGFIDYLHSKGVYNYQAAKNFNFGISGYYYGDRYELQTFYHQIYHQNLENGGITDDRYITDPGAVQGGVTSVQYKSIPTQLTSAKNGLRGAQFFMNHAYKIGYWREEEVNDTLTRDVYIPVMKIIYSFDFKTYDHSFTEKTNSTTFWKNTYFNQSWTDDQSKLNTFSNTIGIYLIEGFRKWIKFGLSAYATYQINKFVLPNQFYLPSSDESDSSGNRPDESESTDGLTPLPSSGIPDAKHNQNFLFIGGRIEKSKGSILRYNAEARFGLSG